MSKIHVDFIRGKKVESTHQVKALITNIDGKILLSTNNDNEFFSLSANSTATEGHRPLDFLSNGIKIREPSSWNLNAANTYIYMAFAEQPLKFANAR